MSGNITGAAQLADLLGIQRRGTQSQDYKNLKIGIIPSWVMDDAPVRLRILMGNLQHKENGVPTEEVSKLYDKSRYKFFLDAPFDLGNRCCYVFKKSLLKTYSKETGRHPMTAQTASESMTRTQQWLKNGCNGFHMKHPISNPMSFWTEQDVLEYILVNKLPIAKVYGEVVVDHESQNTVEGQLSFSDISEWSELGLFDNKPLLKTTGCDRTGCVFCGYGCHHEKEGETRWDISNRVSNPNLADFCLRGGAFDENGLWKPDNRGLGYWFCFEWMNKYGNMKFKYPNRQHYIDTYSTPETDKYLKGD